MREFVHKFKFWQGVNAEITKIIHVAKQLNERGFPNMRVEDCIKG